MTLTDYIFSPGIRKVKIDFPSICNASCIGCYTHSAKKDPDKKLPIEKVREILNNAQGIGIKQLVIAADGEPLLDLNYFFETAESAADNGIETILYTNGSLIAREVAEQLYGLNASVLVKRNSMDHEKQNMLMGADLSERMMEGMEHLKKAGFNHKRLAIESYVSRENYMDLIEVLRFCRANDIMPYFEEFISISQPPKINLRMALSPQELLSAFKIYQGVDREFGIETRIGENSRRYGIEGCSFGRLVSVDTDGNIKQCILPTVYGNVYKDSLESIYERIPLTCSGCSDSVYKS